MLKYTIETDIITLTKNGEIEQYKYKSNSRNAKEHLRQTGGKKLVVSKNGKIISVAERSNEDYKKIYNLYADQEWYEKQWKN